MFRRAVLAIAVTFSASSLGGCRQGIDLASVRALAATADASDRSFGMGGASASELAANVARDIFSARRREGLATGAIDAAPHVRALTAVLRKIATDTYPFALGNEEIALERFFNPAPAPKSQPARKKLSSPRRATWKIRFGQLRGGNGALATAKSLAALAGLLGVH